MAGDRLVSVGRSATGAFAVRSSGALAGADLCDVRSRLAIVDVEVGVVLDTREGVEVLERLAHLGCASGAVEPRAERLARLTLVGEAAHHLHRSFGRVLR